MFSTNEGAKNRPNFFELLGLDPDIPWNQAEFERVLAEKRREWTSLSQGIGSKALEAKLNLGLIGEINRVMADVSLRGKETKEARTKRDKAEVSALDEFKEAVHMAQFKGYVLESEVGYWASRFTALFPGGEKEIREYLASEHVTIKTPKAKAVPRLQLEPLRAREIRDQLQLLGYDTLYTLLSQELHASFDESTSLETLQQAADRLNHEQQKQVNKTVEVTIKIMLSGHAKVIFGSKDQRERYHETLRQEALEHLLQLYEKSGEAAQAIDAKQAENFLREAKQLGWEIEEAREHLVELAAQHAWPLTFLWQEVAGARKGTVEEIQPLQQGQSMGESDDHLTIGQPHPFGFAGAVSTMSASKLQFVIQDDPLSAYLLSTILSAFTELHTKCWLIQQGRFADLMDYTQTRQPRFAQEANLQITRLSYNSPALILFDVVGQALGAALTKTLDAILKAPKETIDAVAQAPERKEAKKLENEAAAQTIEQQQRDAQFQEHLREIEVLKQRAQAELEIAQAQHQQAEERLKTIDIYITYGLHLVEMLQPEADPQTKAMAARALVPQLLAFGQVQGLEITLLSEPEPSQEGNQTTPPSDAAS